MPDRCVSDSGSPLLSLERAVQEILSRVRPVQGREQVAIDLAGGRVLAEDLHSPIDSPPFANAAMDGYALRSCDTETVPAILRPIGTSWAGRPYRGTVAPGHCVRIFTGAALPDGTDAVVMQEEAVQEQDRIILSRRVASQEFVRAAGRDLSSGQRALARGKRLSSIDVGLIAGLGFSEITVYRRVRAAVLSTGDELRPPGSALEFGEIYDGNRFAVKSFLSALGVEITDLGALADDPTTLRDTLTEASRSSDVMITIGGASVGDADHLVPVLHTLGRVDLWKVAIKPGKPFAFGQIGDSYVFGLPGNPVSAIVTFLQIVRPALLQIMGAEYETALRLRARAGARIVKAAGRMEFQRALFTADGDGTFTAIPLAGQEADRLVPLAAANCLLRLPADSLGVEAGEPVTIEPLINYI